jgi:5-methylcytosine-specific restriction endonuclease McrA
VPRSTQADPALGSSRREHVTNATRRAIVERDGLRCSWVDDQGRRCASRAWLEIDHRHPRGKGGSSEARNTRIFCRAHNRFAAEQEYGRDHVERAIQEARHSARHGRDEVP